jgi:hypothetical protein
MDGDLPARSMRYIWRAVAASIACLAIAVPAHACAIDGVPSLRADGVPAVLNRASPSSPSLAHWAPFVFARPFRAGRMIYLSEDLAELARTLPPEMVQGRWLWRTGDGGRVEGRTAAHRFTRAGTYLITVAVELSAHRGAFIFDAALLSVR